MTLTAKALQKKTLEALQAVLEPVGFEPQMRQKLLSRELPFGADLIWVHAARRGSEGRILALWVYVGLRIEIVECLVEGYQSIPSPDLRLTVPTISTTVHSLAPDRTPKTRLIDVKNSIDTQRTIQSLCENVVEIGVPFLEDHHRMEKLLASLTANSALGNALGLPAHRCLSALALWFYSGKTRDKAGTKELISHCREMIRRGNGDAEAFGRLAAFITSAATEPFLLPYL